MSKSKSKNKKKYHDLQIISKLNLESIGKILSNSDTVNGTEGVLWPFNILGDKMPPLDVNELEFVIEIKNL